MNGGKWYQATIRSILENERYAGHCLMQKSLTAKNGKRSRNRGDLPTLLRENTHTPLISQETFDRAREEKAKRAVVRDKGNARGVIKPQSVQDTRKQDVKRPQSVQNIRKTQDEKNTRNVRKAQGAL